MSDYIKPGDWVLFGVLGLLVCSLFIHAWTSPQGDRAVVRAGGKVIAELNLSEDGFMNVAGPLGNTRLEIAHHEIRIASDPSPRQLCVKQGWLGQAGQTALCLPNQVSVEIAGIRRAYDSLNY